MTRTRPPTLRPATSLVDANGPTAPIEALVNALLISAADKRAAFVSVHAGIVRLLIDDTWQVDFEIDSRLAPFLARRLGVMIGVLPPRRGEAIAGRLALAAEGRTIGCLVQLDSDEHGLGVLIELVDPAQLAIRTGPRTPTTHPFR